MLSYGLGMMGLVAWLASRRVMETARMLTVRPADSSGGMGILMSYSHGA